MLNHEFKTISPVSQIQIGGPVILNPEPQASNLEKMGFT